MLTRLLISRLFEFFIIIFDLLVRNARYEGNFDSGIVDIKANIIERQGPPKVNSCNRMPSDFIYVFFPFFFFFHF